MSNNNTTNKIILVNGSTIIPIESDIQPIRGKRSKIVDWSDMCGYIDKDELDGILDEYVVKQNSSNQH